MTAADPSSAGSGCASSPEPRLGRWLRLLGVLSLVVAAIGFLLEGFSDSMVLPRQASFAGLTLLLVGSGVWSLRRWKDATGARLCLALAAATIPVHFAQLGSALWDLHRLGPALRTSCLVSGALLVSLLPVLALGASALQRRFARRVTLLLFALCCPLLLLTRDADQLALMAAGELVLLTLLEVFWLSARAELASLEGLGMRALLTLPLAILLGRSALYPLSWSWFAMVLATPALGALLLARRVEGGKFAGPPRALLEGFGSVLLAGAGLLMSVDHYSPCLGAAGALGVALMLSRPSRLGRAIGAAGLALLACEVSGGLGTGDLFVGCGFVTSVAYVGFGYARREPWGAVGALLCALGFGARELVLRVQVPLYFSWTLPAALGLLLLVAGSAAQAPRGRLRGLWQHLSHHFQDRETGVA